MDQTSMTDEPTRPRGSGSSTTPTSFEKIRTIVHDLAEEAEIHDPASFALSWHILMKGAIVQAAEGDRQAAQRARSIGRVLLEQSAARPAALDPASTS